MQRGVFLRQRGPPRDGVVTIDSPRSQARLGFLRQRNLRTRHLSAAIQNAFACLVLASLDGQPIAQSSRLLLAATARVLNTGSTWNATHSALIEWGGPPTVIEPVTGTVTLRGLDRASSVSLVPLDGARRPMARSAPQAADGG